MKGKVDGAYKTKYVSLNAKKQTRKNKWRKKWERKTKFLLRHEVLTVKSRARVDSKAHCGLVCLVARKKGKKKMKIKGPETSIKS